MKLTSTLIGFLNRVFLKDPHPVLALRVRYPDGGLTWSVEDQVLEITVTGGSGSNFAADLTAYTVSGLATFLAGHAGISVEYLNPDIAALSATAILDGSGDQNMSNGDHLYAFSSLAWAFLDSVAVELVAAEAQIQAMPAQMSIPTAGDVWLDYLGLYYDVPRLAAEPDSIYGPRIIATVLLPRGNNIAIENAIKVYTGQDALVQNVGYIGPSSQYFNGAFNFDGSHIFSAAAPQIQYGLFDLIYSYDLLSGSDPTAFLALVISLIEVLRDAGTHLRSISLAGSVIAESLTRVPTDSFGPLLATQTLFFDGSTKFDGANVFSGSFTYMV